MAEYNAIEITSPRVAEIVRVMCPALQEVDYDKDLHENFVIFDWPTNGLITMVTPEDLAKEKVTLEADGFRMRILRIVIE